MSVLHSYRFRRLVVPLLVLVSTLLLAAGISSAPLPEWWTDTGTKIIDSNTAEEDNYAPANLGQLKNVATQAKKHLDTVPVLSGSARAEITALVNGFQNDPATDYAPVSADAAQWW